MTRSVMRILAVSRGRYHGLCSVFRCVTNLWWLLFCGTSANQAGVFWPQCARPLPQRSEHGNRLKATSFIRHDEVATLVSHMFRVAEKGPLSNAGTAPSHCEFMHRHPRTAKEAGEIQPARSSSFITGLIQIFRRVLSFDTVKLDSG